MNILYSIMFFSVICHVLASETGSGASLTPAKGKRSPIADSAKAGEFREALRKNDVNTALRIFEGGNSGEKDYYGKYLVSLGGQIINDLVKSLGDGTRKTWLLGTVLIHADQVFIKRVFDGVNFSKPLLGPLASNVDLTCKPDKFLHLLRIVSDEKNQTKLVRDSIIALFSGDRTECVDPLLSALGGKMSPHPSLKNDAISCAFWEGSKYLDDKRASYTARYYGHSSISKSFYSSALYRSYKYGKPEYRTFHNLLTEADKKDLEYALKDSNFSAQPDEFKNAIIEALRTTSPKGNRHKDPIKRAELAKETFGDVTEGSLKIEGPADIIAAYVLGDEAMEAFRKVMSEKHAARSAKTRQFRKAIQDRDMASVRMIFNAGNDAMKKSYGEYLVSLGSDALVKLLNDLSVTMDWLLGIIMIYASEDLINEIFKGVRPSIEALKNVAFNVDLACAPDSFLVLLKKISGKKNQEGATRLGVYALFTANRSECVDPLISAIGGDVSLGLEVRNAAIAQAFESATKSVGERGASYAKRYYNHSMILANDYSDALYSSYNNGDPTHELFKWLLVRADRKDLQAAQSDKKFFKQSKEFQDAVNNALSALSPDAETRHQRGRKERDTAIHGALQDKVPQLLANMIAEYDIE